jgi:hypothetical protein
MVGAFSASAGGLFSVKSETILTPIVYFFEI